MNPRRCRDCIHLARPGRSDGYCGSPARSDDLQPAYGLHHPLRRLPADQGAACRSFAPLVPETEKKTEIEQATTPNPEMDLDEMALTISDNSTGDFELPPAGATAARCCAVIDLGSQESTFNGEIKSGPKLMLTFELAELRSDGTPHRVSRRMTASLHKKSQLRAFLEQWRGRPFTDEELKAFNVGKLLGAPCMLNLVHVDRAGKQYANIISVSPLPRGLAAPELSGDAVLFDLAAPDWAVFAGLSPRLQETIGASPEYQAANAPASIVTSTPAPAPAAPAPRPAPADWPPAQPAAKPAPATMADLDQFADLDSVPF